MKNQERLLKKRQIEKINLHMKDYMKREKKKYPNKPNKPAHPRKRKKTQQIYTKDPQLRMKQFQLQSKAKLSTN